MSIPTVSLPTHTYADIMALEPCFDPAECGYCARDWTGTALDVLRHPDVSAADTLWLVLREGWLPDALLHEFAVRCAESALALVDNPDPRSVDALVVKRRWLRGEATDDELAAAYDAADAAAWDARATAWAARAAAWAAADAARAAGATAGAAGAARAARAAADAARAAAGAARAAQVEMLIALIENEVQHVRE